MGTAYVQELVGLILWFFNMKVHVYRLIYTKSVMPSSHFILCHPLLLLPSIFPCIRVFSNVSVLHIRTWPKVWSFSFSISPSMNSQDWFHLGVTGLVSLQSKDLSRVFSNTTVQKHQFFGAQLSLRSNSHIHTTGKTIALTIWTVVNKNDVSAF